MPVLILYLSVPGPAGPLIALGIIDLITDLPWPRAGGARSD